MVLTIGIDLGGTKIRGVLADDKGRVIKSYERPTQAHESRKRIIDNILEVIGTLRVAEVKGIGMACPGFALPNGIMTCMPNIKRLEGFNLKKELEKKTRLKVYLENDANCFALAEHMQGAAKGCRHSVCVIMGTGIGAGIIIDNNIYRGAHGGAGEAGHTKLVINAEVREVEDLISGPSIVKRYEELSGRKAYSPQIILDKKDKYARRVYDETVFYTGLFFANLVNLFNPETIVVGGGVSNLPFYADVRRVVNMYAHPFMAKACKIKKHLLGDDAGAIGAAELALGSR